MIKKWWQRRKWAYGGDCSVHPEFIMFSKKLSDGRTLELAFNSEDDAGAECKGVNVSLSAHKVYHESNEGITTGKGLEVFDVAHRAFPVGLERAKEIWPNAVIRVTPSTYRLDLLYDRYLTRFGFKRVGSDLEWYPPSYQAPPYKAPLNTTEAWAEQLKELKECLKVNDRGGDLLQGFRGYLKTNNIMDNSMGSWQENFVKKQLSTESCFTEQGRTP